MAYVTTIVVAGCRIEIGSACPILNDRIDPAYGEFLDAADDSSSEPFCSVSLEPGLPAGLPDLPVIFDCSPAWVMRGDGTSRWILRIAPGHQLPFWAARVSHDSRNATIFCGDEFVSRRNGDLGLFNPVSYPLDQMLLMLGLTSRGGALLHGAGLRSRSGRGFAFLGRSGAGKTTLSRLLHESDSGTLLSDDRVVFRKDQTGFRLFGTPWPGEGGFARNLSAGLDALFFLVKADEHQIVPLAPAAALQRLLPVASVPWYDAGLVSAALSVCEELVLGVPAFELRFARERRVADLIAEFAATREDGRLAPAAAFRPAPVEWHTTRRPSTREGQA